MTKYYGAVNSNTALKNMIAIQPVSVAVDASNWSTYKTGVFSKCGTSINHAVVAIGWTSTNDWIIRNSWGSNWGENGYIRLKTGNTCGIWNWPAYPVVA